MSQRLVDGVLVTLTAGEEAEHAAWQQQQPPVRRMVAKAVIVQRLIDAGLIDAAYAALSANPSQFARWFAPERAMIYADDDEAITFLNAIGADPDVMLAP